MGVTGETSWRAKGTVTPPRATVSLGRKSTSTQPMPKEATMSTRISSHSVKAESIKIRVPSGQESGGGFDLTVHTDTGERTTIAVFLADGDTVRQALEQLLNQVIAGIVTLEILKGDK